MTDAEHAAEALLDNVKRLRTDALARLEAASDVAGVETLRQELLGRSGSVTAVLRGLAAVPADQRRTVGAAANDAR